MILLPPELRERLLANGRQPEIDHVPVVKFFNPIGIGVWLATELEPDGDTLFGLADLGEPELGAFSLAELTGLRLPLGLGIERDLLFDGMVPISIWADTAREARTIRAANNFSTAPTEPANGTRSSAAPRCGCGPKKSERAAPAS